MKRVADDEETTGLTPPIVDPVPVQVQTVRVGIHVRHVPVTAVSRDGAVIMCSVPSVAPPVESRHSVMNVRT